MNKGEKDITDRIRAYITPILISVLGYMGTSKIGKIEQELKDLNDKTETIISNNERINALYRSDKEQWRAIERLREHK